MKKIIVSSLVMAAVVFTACQSDADADAKKRIEKAEGMTKTEISYEEEEYDFGTISEGEKVEYAFSFTNTGDAPLFIAAATASCGCTVPEVPEEPIAPGESSEIKVIFDSQGKVSDDLTKTITVTANTTPAKTQLTLKGVVKAQ